MRLMVVITIEEEELEELRTLVHDIESGYVNSVHCAIDMDKNLIKRLKKEEEEKNNG